MASQLSPTTSLVSAKDKLLGLASAHDCWHHPLFSRLAEISLSTSQVAGLLRNYDAHASVLRRLLLQAAAIMPEPAVGFVLENVRNEYGNGNYLNNHQLQLQDVAWSSGVTRAQYAATKVEAPVLEFCRIAPLFYLGGSNAQAKAFMERMIENHAEESALMNAPETDFAGTATTEAAPISQGKLKAAIAAGAITATELLAMREFEYMQKAFAKLGLSDHVWFNHVAIEAEHSDESLALALYFIEHHGAFDSVKLGLEGILDANTKLYDGLLASIENE